MGIIATAKVQSIETQWQGEIRHGKHVYLTDKPESFGGQDAGANGGTYDGDYTVVDDDNK